MAGNLTQARNWSSAINTDHRETAHQWAIQILREPNVIFLDTETTGLGDDAEIIDIAIVDRDGRVLLDTLVRPSNAIPPDATVIHGLDDPAVADAPTWDHVYPLVGRILDSYGPVVVYNADFDQRLLQQSNAIYGLPDFTVDWHCAMKQHAAYVGVWHERYGTWRWHKLVDALQMMDRMAPPVQHRALSDAETCRQIVEAMAQGVEPNLSDRPYTPAVVPSTPERDDRDSEPMRPDVIGPDDEERFGRNRSGWETKSGTFAGGSYTVISSGSRGCSPGVLMAIVLGGGFLLLAGCCGLFYLLFQVLG